MTKLKKAILILSLLYVEVEMQIFLKSYEVDRKELLLDKDNDHLATDSESLSYVVFRKENDNSKIIDCNVTTKSDVEDKKPSKQCNHKIQSEDTAHEMDTLSIRALGKDKVLLYRTSNNDANSGEATFKASLINMKDCKSTDIHLKIKKQFVYVSPYKSTFDIITRDSSNCNGKLCVLTFDHTGNRIGEPVILPERVNLPGDVDLEIEPIASKSSSLSKGYYALLNNHYTDEFHIFSVKSDGGVKASMTVTQPKQEYYPFFTSSEHELFSMCLLNEDATKANCSQMGKDLYVKLNTTFDFPDDAGAMMKNVHSLKDGGMLIGLIDKAGIYRIYKINQNGWIGSQYVALSHLNCPIRQFRPSYNEMFEKDDQICFSSHCEYEAHNNDGDHKLVVKCISQSTLITHL